MLRCRCRFRRNAGYGEERKVSKQDARAIAERCSKYIFLEKKMPLVLVSIATSPNPQRQEDEGG